MSIIHFDTTNAASVDGGLLYGGRVTSTGVGSPLPTGWSSSRLSTGRYRITHNLGTTAYAVTAMINGTSFPSRVRSSTLAKTSVYFDLYWYSATDGILSNQNFDFIVSDNPNSVGEVTSTGTGTILPTGWSSVRNSTGQYTITHNLGTTNYQVVSMMDNTSAPFRNAPATNSAIINTFQKSWYSATDGTYFNRDWQFIVDRNNNGGRVLSSGSPSILPAGWSSVRNSLGTYTITHNLGTTNYAVTAMRWLTAAGFRNRPTISSRASNSFQIRWYSATDGSFQDNAFHFLLTRI